MLPFRGARLAVLAYLQDHDEGPAPLLSLYLRPSRGFLLRT